MQLRIATCAVVMKKPDHSTIHLRHHEMRVIGIAAASYTRTESCCRVTLLNDVAQDHRVNDTSVRLWNCRLTDGRHTGGVGRIGVTNRHISTLAPFLQLRTAHPV